MSSEGNTTNSNVLPQVILDVSDVDSPMMSQRPSFWSTQEAPLHSRINMHSIYAQAAPSLFMGKSVLESATFSEPTQSTNIIHGGSTTFSEQSRSSNLISDPISPERSYLSIHHQHLIAANSVDPSGIMTPTSGVNTPGNRSWASLSQTAKIETARRESLRQDNYAVIEARRGGATHSDGPSLRESWASLNNSSNNNINSNNNNFGKTNMALVNRRESRSGNNAPPVGLSALNEIFLDRGHVAGTGRKTLELPK